MLINLGGDIFKTPFRFVNRGYVKYLYDNFKSQHFCIDYETHILKFYLSQLVNYNYASENLSIYFIKQQPIAK